MKVREAVVSPPPAAWDVDCSGDPGRTKQEFVRDCDVNLILARCLSMRAPLPGADVQAAFADVSGVGSFADCVRRVKAAEDAFAGLDAPLRLRFGNDPVALLAFLEDDANRDEAVKLGLVAAPVVPPVGAPPAAPGGAAPGGAAPAAPGVVPAG